MTETSWPAPAKINHFLHVTGRREDGYHLLQTLFQFLDYCDVLDFKTRNDGVINLHTNNRFIDNEQNLAVIAARILQGKSGGQQGVDIHINKIIPIGGGLGGGSSDAATTLVALNHIWKLGLSAGDLAKIGLDLGADVPVFVNGYAAWAEGIGERLSSVDIPEDWILVVNPGIHVNTAEIFASRDLTRNTPAITIRDFLAGRGRNDCEPVVAKLYPEVADVIDWLGKISPARMTGTGASVFASFSSKNEAMAALDDIPGEWAGFVAKAENRSPLLDRLARE